MFVKKLEINEFKGIKRCKKEIPFSNFTVLIGRNNAGKSSILEALSLLPSYFVNDIISDMHKNQYLSTLYEGRSGNSSFLYLHAGESHLKYDLGDFMAEMHFDMDNHNSFIVNGKRIRDNYDDIGKVFNIDEKMLSKLVLFIPNNTKRIEELERKIHSFKNLIMKKGIHIRVAEFINKCVDDKYSELVFQESITIRKIFSNNTFYLPLNDLGSGVEKILKIMSLVEVINPKLILIDDFESGLHPSLINMFIEWLKDGNWQVILSTHSIDVLNSIVDITPIDTSVLLLKKDSEDILNYEVFNLDKLTAYINSNTDPRYLIDAFDL